MPPTTDALPPEAALLLACARVRLAPPDAETLRRLAERRPDWDRVIGDAARHGVLPLVHEHLRDLDAVPEPARETLHRLASRIARHNLMLTGVLRDVLDLFEREGLPAIPYKGPVLAASVYGNVALRPFSDLDVLVPPGDAPRARAMLTGHGFRFVPEAAGLDEAAAVARGREYRFERDPGVILEVQWRVVSASDGWRRFSLAPVWTRLRTTTLARRTVPTLGPEDRLAVLSLHGAHNQWVRLKWIVDVAEVVRGGSVAWETLFANAEAWGIRRPVLLGLALARDLLGAPLPPEVHARLEADPALPRLAAMVRRRLFIEPRDPPPELPLFLLRLRENRREKLFFAVRLAFASTPRDAARLPAPLAFLAPLLRPFRLLALLARRLRPDTDAPKKNRR
ncbi:nucleotidyltransferase domain-containing protein [Rhodocaloribacter sp.]